MVTLPDGTVLTDCVTVTASTIYIDAQTLIHKDFTLFGKEYLLDIFGRDYCGQDIYVIVFDGENIKLSGFVDYLKYLCDLFSIEYARVTISSHSPEVGPFKHVPMSLGIFESTGASITDQIDTDLSQAKFVGALLGRFNPTRLRLAYELDQMFPNDNYLVFRPNLGNVDFNYQNYQSLYQTELNWVHDKTFDQDITDSENSGSIKWQQSSNRYANIWNRFCIEIVSETDAVSNYWFTEKTARCLATGKPFTLVAGAGSLAKLRSMGFKTFGDVIDESYDLETVPYRRIKRMLASLLELHQSADKLKRLDALYNIAKQNILLYKQFHN